MEEKKTIGVIGLGLIGASLCKALCAAGHRILGMDRDEHVQKYALLTGTIQEELTEEKIPECDFLFLGVYPGAAVETLRRLAPRIRQETIVCDLCGVKKAVCEPCFALAEEYGFPFIGGHPMAGKQNSGIKYADEKLYQGATMILVPRKQEDLRDDHDGGEARREHCLYLPAGACGFQRLRQVSHSGGTHVFFSRQLPGSDPGGQPERDHVD